VVNSAELSDMRSVFTKLENVVQEHCASVEEQICRAQIAL
jgi:hypothetical protein